ncbi:MAG: hypothetical protein ABR920_11785 [Terriglobales bacterium]
MLKNSAHFRVFRHLVAMASSVLFLASLLAPVSARGSGGEKPKSYALIFGTVWGPDRHPLYGVKVKIRRAEEKKARWELYSNHTGEFAQRLPVGKADYIVWADVKGYKLPSGRKLKPGSEVTVHIDHDERSDIGLHLDW